MLHNKNYYKGELLYVGIVEFCTHESLTKVIDHMFLVGLIFLEKHYINGGIKDVKVKDEITSIVGRT